MLLEQTIIILLSFTALDENQSQKHVKYITNKSHFSAKKAEQCLINTRNTNHHWCLWKRKNLEKPWNFSYELHIHYGTKCAAAFTIKYTSNSSINDTVCCLLYINGTHKNKTQSTHQDWQPGSICINRYRPAAVKEFNIHTVVCTASSAVCCTPSLPFYAAARGLRPSVCNVRDCTSSVCFRTNVTATNCSTFLHLAKEVIVFLKMSQRRLITVIMWNFESERLSSEHSWWKCSLTFVKGPIATTQAFQSHRFPPPTHLHTHVFDASRQRNKCMVPMTAKQREW